MAHKYDDGRLVDAEVKERLRPLGGADGAGPGRTTGVCSVAPHHVVDVVVDGDFGSRALVSPPDDDHGQKSEAAPVTDGD